MKNNTPSWVLLDENLLFSVIKRKGSMFILEDLRFFGKRYNQIKNELIQSISARTLDHRLRDLVGVGLIEVEVLNEEIPEGRGYYITKKGMIAESIHHAFYDLSLNFGLEEIIEHARLRYAFTARFNWNAVWSDLKQILERETSIETIVSFKKNTIEFHNDKGIQITTEKGSNFIEIDMIKHVWANLLEYKQLDLVDYERTTYRSSFICALLSYLDYVDVVQGRRKSIILLE